MVKLSQSMKNLSKFDIIKHQLSKLQSEIDSFDTQEKNIPELIDKANLLRQNELLKKIIEKKSSLNDVYTSYIYILEQLLIKPNLSKPRTRTSLKKSSKPRTRTSLKKSSKPRTRTSLKKSSKPRTRTSLKKQKKLKNKKRVLIKRSTNKK
jgi:hypothetical protein